MVGSRTFSEFTYRDIGHTIQSMRAKDKAETPIKHAVGALSNIWNRAMANELPTSHLSPNSTEKAVIKLSRKKNTRQTPKDAFSGSQGLAKEQHIML